MCNLGKLLKLPQHEFLVEQHAVCVCINHYSFRSCFDENFLC